MNTLLFIHKDLMMTKVLHFLPLLGWDSSKKQSTEKTKELLRGRNNPFRVGEGYLQPRILFGVLVWDKS
jgi:hypothetical protein